MFHEPEKTTSDSKSKTDIYIPGVRVRPEYEEEEAGRPPFLWYVGTPSMSFAFILQLNTGVFRPSNNAYIEFQPLKAEIDRYVEYELDEEDEQFIAKLNDPQVTEQVFELIFDFLEKESFKQVRVAALILSKKSALYLFVTAARISTNQTRRRTNRSRRCPMLCM